VRTMATTTKPTADQLLRNLVNDVQANFPQDAEFLTRSAKAYLDPNGKVGKPLPPVEQPDAAPEGARRWEIGVDAAREECEANAQLIVTAVNSHEALVYRLQEAARVMCAVALELSKGTQRVASNIELLEKLHEEARAALTAARGK
jgi:hypothetical protein